MEDQGGKNFGLIRVSYILGTGAFLSIFLSTVLGITSSILSLITSFLAIIIYKNRSSIYVFVFNAVVFLVIFLGLYFIISSFNILE